VGGKVAMNSNLTDKKFLVLGAGVTGKSVARSLVAHGSLVTVADDYSDEGIKTDGISLENFDAVVVSPGWRLDHPLLVKALKSGLEIHNEVDLAWQIKSEIAPSQKWLAITGTNGKTTAVEMVAKILQTAGLKAKACGNVGETVIEAVEEKDPFDYLVLELSSFQLHWVKNAQFYSSVILNIAHDHIDWHSSFDLYAQAKLSLLERSEIAILNADDGEVVSRSASWRGRKVFFTLNTPAPGEIGVVEELIVDRCFVSDPMEAEMICEINDVKPTIPHNVSNAMAAAALALSIDVPHKVIQKALQEFRPGKHRIEMILENDAVSWIDDSKATNPHAAIASLNSHLSVIWIAGGLSKGADIEGLVHRCKSRMKAVILIGEDSDLIERALEKFAPEVPRVKVDSPNSYVKGQSDNSLMEEVVTKALTFATSGDTVLLAPACASMDQFVSYADRGDRFAAAVKKLVPHAN
jgi:UDP-N-acetylmuramoylalanine--D-glutamate ligase